MPTGLADVQDSPEASSVPATASPPDSCAVTEVSLPLATLTWICEAGSALEVLEAGLMTTTAAEEEDDVLCAAPEVLEEDGPFEPDSEPDSEPDETDAAP